MTSFTDRFQHYSREIRRRIRERIHGEDDHMNDQLVNQDPSQSNMNATGGYTELMGGSVPCPSCNGSGMIPKELEQIFVALIPLNDDRLKPKKTWRTILIWITICLMFGSSVIFVVMPRTVTVTSLQRPISVVHVFRQDPESHQYIDFDFMNRVNVSSGNYLPVSVVNVSATIVSKFQPWSVDVIGHGFNDSVSAENQLTVYGRGTTELYFNNTVGLKSLVAQYCQADFANYTALYVTMKFDISVTLQYYYGHQEQVMTSLQQQVCCIPRGNCTIV